MRGTRIGLALIGSLLGVTLGGAARAEPDALEAGAQGAEGSGEEAAAYRALSRPPGGATRLFATAAFGTGLRLNNPYRLKTQLGDDAESLSLTSGYLDLGGGLAFGDADGIQHGAALHLSFALSGVSQQAITPSYLLAYRGPGRVLVYGRLGASILTQPDFNVGGELAGGLGFFITSRIALAGELVGDLFYGAATYEATYTVYPVLSGQLGLMVDYEVLP